jgi:cytochrome c biogenesis protein
LTLWLVVVAAALPAILVRPFRRWLSSMSGAIWILSALTVLSLLGVTIGQNLPPEVYQARYGPTAGSLLVRSGLTGVFGSWYFLFLVSVLAVSLIACSAGRLRKVALANTGPKVARAGTLIVHVALIVILTAGVVTGVFGFRYVAPPYLGAGDEMVVVEGDFTIRVNAASTEFTEEGQVSEYYSDVTVLDGGREVLSQRIEVNRPLIYGGVGLYQHEMHPSPTSLDKAVLGVRVRTPEGEGPLHTYLVPFREEFAVPDTDITLKVLEFLSDFTYDIERRTAELASNRHRNPAVLVQLAESGRVLDDLWLFADSPTHQTFEGMPCRVFLLDYVPDFSDGRTRFEISRQPGTPLLFAGFLAMSLGLAMIFWTRAPEQKLRGEDRSDAKGGTDGNDG